MRTISIAAAGWLVWTAANCWVMYAAGLPLQPAVTDSLISNLLLAAAAIFLTNLLKHYLPGQGSYVNLVAIVAAITFLWFLVSRTAVLAALKEEIFTQDFFQYTGTIRFAIGLLVLTCIALIIVLRRTMEEKAVQQQRKSDAEKLAREAELIRLRQQLQPHFLFNSLNSISALVSRDPGQARNMIETLSDFLRSTVRKEGDQMASLEEEFRDLNLYLSIEKLRFGHRLDAEIFMPEDTKQLKIPALLLQPVVENAIKFGVYETTGNVNIKITAEKKDQLLIVSISNPFDPETAQVKTGTGFGLTSVQRRLYLLFARTDLLKITEKENQFITSIIIPQP
ncbi:sensor histidine kinase [Pollutibacter soli]|uniref:sensor histidine kinase n=1 Tax=Pollutibacter soli TaxID=3034157 RepID=UPI0030140C58